MRRDGGLERWTSGKPGGGGVARVRVVCVVRDLAGREGGAVGVVDVDEEGLAGGDGVVLRVICCAEDVDITLDFIS